MLPVTVLRPAAGDLPLDRAEVLRYLGYKPGVTRTEARHEELVDRGIGLALEAARPAVSLAYCAVEVRGDEIATRVPGLTWRSRSLARLLAGAGAVTLVAATLGAGVEEATARLFREEEYALATIVDAAGSALVHGLSQYCRTYIAAQAGDLALTPLYGPGYGDWPIQDQVALTEAAGGPAIGLTSTPTCYLVPQKSLVGLVGWGAAGRTQSGAGTSGCLRCTMRDCAYRQKA
jgi:hypothetical protein